MTYTVQIGPRVLEFDPQSGVTRQVSRVDKQTDKGWYTDEQGQMHYGTTVDLKQTPRPPRVWAHRRTT